MGTLHWVVLFMTCAFIPSYVPACNFQVLIFTVRWDSPAPRTGHRNAVGWRDSDVLEFPKWWDFGDLSAVHWEVCPRETLTTSISYPSTWGTQDSCNVNLQPSWSLNLCELTVAGRNSSGFHISWVGFISPDFRNGSVSYQSLLVTQE